MDGGLIGKLCAIQGLSALCDLLQQSFTLGLLFGKLVLYLGTQILVGLKLILVFRSGNLFFDIFDLGQQCGICAGCFRGELALKFLSPVLQIGGGPGNVQGKVAGGVHVGNIIAQLGYHAALRHAFELADADGVVVSGLGEAAQQKVQKTLGRLYLLACGFIHNHERLLILLKVPLQAVNDPILFHPHLPTVYSLVLPRLIFAVKIRAGRPAASTLQAEQHAADEGVQRGFSGFVPAVNHIEVLVKRDGKVMEFAESVNM